MTFQTIEKKSLFNIFARVAEDGNDLYKLKNILPIFVVCISYYGHEVCSEIFGSDVEYCYIWWHHQTYFSEYRFSL